MRILVLKITSLILLLSVELAVYAFFNFRRHIYPTWSPKSHLIAFESKTELNFHGERHIWLLDSISSKSSRLIKGTNPSWIADGQKIAFIREFDEEKNRNGEIYSIKIDGSELFKISDNWKGYNPYWSSDAKKLAFMYQLSGKHKVYVIDFKTTKFIDITKNKLPEDVFSIQESVSWSPNNQEIVFCVVKLKDHTSVIDYSKIYITKVDETSKINFVAEGYSPSWSPDNKKIAFSLDNRVAIINFDGSGFKFLSEHLEFSNLIKAILLLSIISFIGINYAKRHF